MNERGENVGNDEANHGKVNRERERLKKLSQNNNFEQR